MSEYKPIIIRGARQNNLKNLSVEFPSRALSVITGPSGSGKSSLAFETLYAEGQRRYVESLSTYTRQFLDKMAKPDVDVIDNIPPAIALEQRNTVLNSRSTVGSQTEVVDYLRILYSKIGNTVCLNCKGPVLKMTPEVILEHSVEWMLGRKVLIIAPVFHSALHSKKSARLKKEAQHALFQTLMEQGYQRLVWFKSEQEPIVLELEELLLGTAQKLPESAFQNDRLWIVVDRARVRKAPLDQDETTRLQDSLSQALRLGRGSVQLLDSESFEQKTFKEGFACIRCGTPHTEPEPQLFSFNSPMGACQRCSGFGFTLDFDEALMVPDPKRTLKNGAVDPLHKPAYSEWESAFFKFLERHGISVGRRYSDLSAAERNLIWNGSPQDKRFPGVLGFFKKLESKKYKLHVRVFIRRYQSQSLCPECGGTRLVPQALAVEINHTHIGTVLKMPINQAKEWVQNLTLSEHNRIIATEALKQLERRLHFLDLIGVGYLSLDRLTKTLSGGEFQRINLATQLGNGLCGTLYVLDEPSIGLHATDTDRLISILKDLRDQGNTVVVVEHDLDVMRAADWLVEIGPASGRGGGELIEAAPLDRFVESKASITARYLNHSFEIGRVRRPRPHSKRILKMTGCREHNLKNITLEIPLDRFVVVTGPSGSGKSTLIHKTLFPALHAHFENLPAPSNTGAFDALYGAAQLQGVVLLDQKPIGKSSRSNPATYLKAWDEIRKTLANQVLSLRRGYTPAYFSFNVDGGRCPVCKGEGEIAIDMHFMAEVKVPCEECNGKRFKNEVLEVYYKGKNVYDILSSTIDEAYDLFRDNPVLVRKFSILREVGLGYLQVGQPAPTLSGGESQRLKIAHALDQREHRKMLYLFDEPTTGLHQEDIRKLLEVLQDLVDTGQSVVMIEHQLDVIAQADWVIDLGPGGGDAGGYLIAEAPPAELTLNPESLTGQSLLKSGFSFPEARTYPDFK